MARWRPLFTRVPEGGSLKSDTLAREIKTLCTPKIAVMATTTLKSEVLAREIKTLRVYQL